MTWDENTLREAKTLAAEYWNGQAWDTLKEWQQEDCLIEAANRVGAEPLLQKLCRLEREEAARQARIGQLERAIRNFLYALDHARIPADGMVGPLEHREESAFIAALRKAVE